jgi:SAM-dependent methyltransferase
MTQVTETTTHVPETDRQQEKWETYWKETHDIATTASYDKAKSVWDTDVDRTVDLDVERLRPHFDPKLPVLDVGCGSGQQTVRLARHFRTVLGTDVSPSAVALAAAVHGADNLTYEVLDGLDLDAAKAIHQRLGDVNLYVRTVIHVFGPTDRKRLAEVLQTLIGERGTLYSVELGLGAVPYFEAWAKTNGMPVKLDRVMSKGLRPGPVGREHIESLFPPAAYEVLADGEVIVPGIRMTSRELMAAGNEEGALWEPPYYYSIIRKRRMRS